MERIYTIPVNEALEKVTDGGVSACPFCMLYNKLESDELDLILGASMMEPDVRLKTNELGFCDTHLSMMFAGGKRLPLALILESHLDTTAEKMDGSASTLFAQKTADGVVKKLEHLSGSCYVCDRIEYNFKNMIETAVLLWQQEEKIRERMRNVPFFCLKHYPRLLKAGRERLSRREFAEFYSDVSGVEDRYFTKLREDVSFFCKKFDYRYTDEPWGDSKDAPERAQKFLSGNLHVREKGDRPAADTLG